MEKSILIAIKLNLGVAESFTHFDEQILTHINSAFSTLHQLGVGPAGGFFIEDDSARWTDIGLPDDQVNAVRAYLYLKVRQAWDPPKTSFEISSFEEQIKQHEFRLSIMREEALDGN